MEALAKSATPVTIWPLTAGLFSETTPTQIPDGATSSSLNVLGFEGKLKPRPGFAASSLLDLGGNIAVYHLSRLASLTGTQTQVALGIDTGTLAVRFYEWNGAAWVDRTGAAVLAGTLGYHPTSCSFKGELYFTVGGSDLYSWTGAGNIAAVTGAAPGQEPFERPQIVIAWDGRLWEGDVYAGGSRVPYRVAWSDHNLDNVWRGGVSGGSSGYQDLIDSKEDDTMPITAMIDLSDSLFAFKAERIYKGDFVDYPKYYEFRKLFTGVGCISQATLQRNRDQLLFLGDNNIYLLEPGALPKPLGTRIRTRLIAACAAANLQRAAAIVDPFNELYWLFLPKTGTTNNVTMFILNIREGSWWEGEIANANILPLCTLAYRPNTWTRQLLIGSQDGNTYQLDAAAFTDGGTAMATPYWEGKEFDCLQISRGANPFETAQVIQMGVHARSGKITAKVKVADALDGFVTKEIGELVMDGGGHRYRGASASGRFIKPRLEWSDMTDPAEVEGLTLHIVKRGAERNR